MVDQKALVRPLFAEGDRSDDRQSGFNEPRYSFLDRSSWPYADAVRALLVAWLTEVPADAQNDLIGRLKAANDQHEGAFWELYLHEAYRRSGYHLELHPPLANSRRRPDFLVSSVDGSFYLEATSLNESKEAASADRRLADVYDVLSRLEIRDFYIGLFDYAVGPTPLATKQLRADLKRWLATLDIQDVERQIEADPAWAPSLSVEYGEWSLKFHAFLRSAAVRDEPKSALAVMGAGEASMVDHSSRLIRAITGKADSYGNLDHPLVVAVLANTDTPTRDAQVERALFGAATQRPTPSFVDEADFFQAGVWASAGSWNRSHMPQVIVSSELNYRTVGTNIPKLWSSLSNEAIEISQPEWLAPVHLEGSHPEPVAPKLPIADHLGITSDWLCAAGFQ